MTERISEAEQAVMEVLWEESPLTAQEVAERVPAERDWSANTVKTLLGRLLAKSIIGHEEDGRRYRYRPLVERADGVIAPTPTAASAVVGATTSATIC